MSLPSVLWMMSVTGEVRKCFINCGWYADEHSIVKAIHNAYSDYKQLDDDEFTANEFIAYNCRISFQDLRKGKEFAASCLREATPDELKRFEDGLKK